MALVQLPPHLSESKTVNYDAAEVIQNRLYHQHNIEVNSFHNLIICRISVTRSYLFTEFQDEHTKPMEESMTLLHSIVLMYANLCTIAHPTLLFWQDKIKQNFF